MCAFLKTIFLASISFWVGAAGAWDGFASGKISQIDTVLDQNNYEFRVYLGGQAMCNIDDPALKGWAYLNSSDNNYKAITANLLLAYASGKIVGIYTLNDSGRGCHIHYVTVAG